MNQKTPRPPAPDGSPDTKPRQAGMPRSPQPPEERGAADLRKRSAASQERLRANERQVVQIGKLLLALVALWAGVVLWNQWRRSQVVSSEPIGVLHGMTAGAGWRGGSVIEVRTTNETRFYPLEGPMAATQGTPLVLETRANGNLFVCDAKRHACAQTAPDMLR